MVNQTILANRLKPLKRYFSALKFPDSLAYQEWQQRFLQQRLNLSVQLAILAYFTFILLRIGRNLANPASLQWSWYVMAICVEIALIACFVLLHSQRGQRHLTWIFLTCSWSVTLFEQVWATWRGVAFPGIFAWTLVFLTQATIVPIRWHLHMISQLGVLAYYLGVNSLLGLKEEGPSYWTASFWLYLFWFCCICDLAVFLYERLQRSEFHAHRELEAEKEKSEGLLLNILPETVAQQLKRDKRTIAESFAEATVLFADIVNFTQISASIPPQDMVRLLNEIFSTFDQLVEVHGLEKIKTIGDAYMVVGGLPIERPDHAEAIANMALDMQKAIAQFNIRHEQPFSIRIGINSGPVVAGVIGVKKFIYDLWGDTVNTASRMESQGLPGCIQVTERVYDRLKDAYELEERGLIPVKGKGEMRVYLLKRRCSAID